jgi:hypothetical protein
LPLPEPPAPAEADFERAETGLEQGKIQFLEISHA